MSVRALVVLALAVVCGGSAAVGVSVLRGRAVAAKVDTLPVVVASQDIARGQVVGLRMLKIKNWPKDLLPGGAIRDPDTVDGRTILVSVQAGEPLLEAKLADRDSGRGLAALIPQGWRAVTIQTSRVASNVAGFVLPGNRVDVLLTLRGGNHDATGGGSSTTLLQAVEILAVDQRLDAPAENRVDPKLLRSVTLLVTPDQAGLLDLGQNMGTLSLSLRNPEDLAKSMADPATVNMLRFTQRQPIPASSGEKQLQWLKTPMKWLTAAAVSMPLTMGAVKPDRPSNQFLEIRTIRGRHSGRVYVKP